MGQTLGMGIFLVLALAAIGRGVGVLVKLEATAAEFARSWQEEYAVRRCGELAAATANLRDAGESIAALDPASAHKARLAAGELAAALARIYGGEPAPDEYGRCTGSSGWTAELHEERHPGQPRVWPNWVMRLVATGGAD